MRTLGVPAGGIGEATCRARSDNHHSLHVRNLANSVSSDEAELLRC
jgi:hypothetical protein